jgi:T1SS-143 domain-containing protein
VTLVGFVEANAAAPLVVETSDGQPIDIATLLASTDPDIDIQTAAGPAQNDGRLGADNTGAILAQLAAGNGLDGLSAVGAQDGTAPSYGTIDNAIRQEFSDAITPFTASSVSFPGVSEPFLRDPFNAADYGSFEEFFEAYQAAVNAHPTANPGPGWADFTGSAASGSDFHSYAAETGFTNLVTHSSTTHEALRIDEWELRDILADGANGGAHPWTSDGSKLCVTMSDDGTTAFISRDSDGALVMVIHAHAAGDLNGPFSTGNFEIDTYLINRLDHPDQGQDILDLTIPWRIDHPMEGGEEQGSEQFFEEVPPTVGTAEVQILDDVPIASQTEYASFLHAASYKDAFSCLTAFVLGKVTDYTITTDGGHVDEDYIFGGNHDKDNAAGPDSDPARGDDIGDQFVVGAIMIDWGADGPAGKIPEPSEPDLGDLLSGPACPPLTIKGLCEGDKFSGATSNGHELKVLSHESVIGGLEVLQVGYCDCGKDITVFTLVLQANPNLPLFGAFAFELSEPLDHAVAGTPESNLSLVFPIVATDDDGDHPLNDVNITILVNDDAPAIKDVEYISQKGGIPESDEVPAFAFGGSGTIESHQYGQVDEDWLKGNGNKDKDGTGENNAGPDTDGDDYGKTAVKGKIEVAFGADGPAAHDPFAFTETFDTNDKLPVFKDAGGNAFTSDDHALVVLSSDPGFLVVGYLPDGDDPKAEPVVIFTMELKDSGKFEFDLCGPIDHTGQNEQSLDIKFGVTVTDRDGDTAPVTLDIKVNDDKPEIGICYINNLAHDFQDGEAPPPAARLAAVGPNGVITTEDFGHVDEDWLKGAEGNSYIGNQDKECVAGDDIGKSEVAGQILVNYGGDGASGDDAGFALQYTKDAIFKDAAGNGYKSGDQDLYVLEASGDHILVGIQGTEKAIFELDVTASGKFDFKLWGPIDHAVAGTPESNTLLTFNVGSVSDKDDDTVDAIIKIQVNDDSPEAAVTYTSHKDTSEDGDIDSTTDGFGYIDEDFLGDPPANTDNDNSPFAHKDSDRGDTYGTNSCYGAISLASFGADGPGNPGSTFGLAQISGAFKDADGNPVTQNGMPLVVLDSTATHLSVGLAGGSPVFELNLDGGGTFNFQLYGPLDQSDESSERLENNLMLSFLVAGDATDADGDPAKAVIRIRVNDDAPVADCIDAKCTYAGSIWIYDHQGADGATVTSIRADGEKAIAVDQDGADSVAIGKYGALIIHDDGTWSYYANATPTAKGGIDTFTYTLTDGDGDKASATLKIEVAGPTHTIGHYDHSISVSSDTDKSSSSSSWEISDSNGGHTLKGGSDDDHLLGKGGDDTLYGRDGADILEGGNGRDELHGGHDDDTIFGGAGNDTLFGEGGTDAQSGGTGGDTFKNIDADDLDGTNTLDGIHSIDGGIDNDGSDVDIVELGGLSSFGAAEAARIENVEVLDFRNGGLNSGTDVTLNYDSVYGITQVGGLHALTVHADAGSDIVTLENTPGKDWAFAGSDGTYNTYTAGVGAAQVTVHVDKDVAVAV